MLIAGRPGLWDDWIRFQRALAQKELEEAQARRRAALIAAQKEEELILMTCIGILFFIFVGIIFGFIYIITR
jgi:hypothetical protein